MKHCKSFRINSGGGIRTPTRSESRQILSPLFNEVKSYENLTKHKAYAGFRRT